MLQRRIRKGIAPLNAATSILVKPGSYDSPVYQLGVALRSSPFSKNLVVSFSAILFPLYNGGIALPLLFSLYYPTIQQPHPKSLQPPEFSHQPSNNDIYRLRSDQYRPRCRPSSSSSLLYFPPRLWSLVRVAAAVALALPQLLHR